MASPQQSERTSHLGTDRAREPRPPPPPLCEEERSWGNLTLEDLPWQHSSHPGPKSSAGPIQLLEMRDGSGTGEGKLTAVGEQNGGASPNRHMIQDKHLYCGMSVLSGV